MKGIWWEIYADEDGGLIVERHGGEWVFVPSAKRRTAPIPPKDPGKVLPPNIVIDRWGVV